jgi:uncharacterized repeat protein (TIGR01451 family)
MSTGAKFRRPWRRRNVVGATAIVALVVVALLTIGAASARVAAHHNSGHRAAGRAVSSNHLLSRAHGSASRASRLARHALLSRSSSLSADVRLASITGCGADGSLADASGFEAADANLAIDTTGCMDWNGFTPTWSGTAPFQTGIANNNGFAFAGATDAVNSTSDSIYAGGVKQDTVCPSTVIGKANDKADLAAMYVSTERIGSQVYLFLAWERQLDTTIQSDVFVSFEFNQGNVSCGSGSPFLQRTEGDLLFDYNFQSGVSSITAEQWDGTTWQPLSTPPFEALVNTADVTDTIRPDAPVVLTTEEFGEAGINLSGISLGGNGGKACETFGSVLGGSRTSKSGDTAQLKDFVGPAPFDASNCVQPTATTTLKNAADDSTISDPPTVPYGSSVYDTTTLGNLVDGKTPTGKVQYTFFTNGDCSGTGSSAGLVTLNADGTVPNSNTEGPLSAGDYSFEAQYLSGNDSNYSDSEVSACEPFSVNKQPTSISTVATSASNGDPIHDVATLSGATGDAGGTITFNLYGPSATPDCSGEAIYSNTVGVDGPGDYNSGDFTPSAPGNYYWIASYSGDDNNLPSSGSCGDEGETSTVRAASIHILKTPDAAQVNVGSPIGFTMTVWNDGSGDAHGVKLSDTLPTNAGLSWTVAAQGTGWGGSCVIAAGVLTCGPVTVPAGTTQSASTFTVHITSPTTGKTGGDCPATGVVNNTGSVTTSNDGNGDSSASVCVQAVVDLAITKSGSPATQELGTGNITWTMVVTNNGPSDDTNVTVSDPMPAGNTYVSSSTTQGSCTGGAILNCNIGFMAAGASVTITLVTTPSQEGTQTNTAVVMGSRPESNLANNTATASVDVTGVHQAVSCVQITKLTPGQLIVGRKTLVTIHLFRKVGPSVKGVKVRIKGAGINVKTKGANSRGVIKKTLKLKKKGILIFTPLASPSCGAKRIGVRGVFTPPVTG